MKTIPHKFTVISSMGEYAIVEQSTNKIIGHTVTEEDDGRNAISALYAECEEMNGE